MVTKNKSRGWKDPKNSMESKKCAAHQLDNSQHQKTSTDKLSPSDSAKTHAAPLHPTDVGVHPTNKAAGDTTIVLASSISKHKHFHESDHSDSDKEAATNVDPPVLELTQENTIIVPSTSAPDNSSGWIIVRKKKGKKDVIFPISNS